jgi:hypothetical protein
MQGIESPTSQLGRSGRGCLGINEKVGRDGIRCELVIGDGWGALSLAIALCPVRGQSRQFGYVRVTSAFPPNSGGIGIADAFSPV